MCLLSTLPSYLGKKYNFLCFLWVNMFLLSWKEKLIFPVASAAVLTYSCSFIKLKLIMPISML